MMTKPDFLYVTYIATTPEKVWRAFVEPDLMRQYWIGPSAGSSRVNVSDWKPGSRWEHQHADDTSKFDIAGKVVESISTRRLAYTWARPNEVEDPSKHSNVTIDIEPHGEGLIRLTLSHQGLERDPKMLAGVSGGWPKILSNLKTLLETGKPLPNAALAG
jgi:uncharacterized protein YndB with AHSA1/START domain